MELFRQPGTVAGITALVAVAGTSYHFQSQIADLRERDKELAIHLANLAKFVETRKDDPRCLDQMARAIRELNNVATSQSNAIHDLGTRVDQISSVLAAQGNALIEIQAHIRAQGTQLEKTFPLVSLAGGQKSAPHPHPPVGLDDVFVARDGTVDDLLRPSANERKAEPETSTVTEESLSNGLRMVAQAKRAT